MCFRVVLRVVPFYLLKSFAYCVQVGGCTSYTFNVYGQCYLRSALGIVRADDPRHGTVTCARMTGYDATWRERTWPFAGMYRLTDIVKCSRLAEHLITRQAELRPNIPFSCGGLDPANNRLQWPGSIGDSYAQQAKVPYDLDALRTVIDRQITLNMSCGAARPRRAACVFHIRAGDIFRSCTAAQCGPAHNQSRLHCGDCVAHSAAELWRGNGSSGTAWRSTIGETMVQPRSYFERALRNSPSGTRSAILVGQFSTQASMYGVSTGSRHPYLLTHATVASVRGTCLRPNPASDVSPVTSRRAHRRPATSRCSQLGSKRAASRCADTRLP